MLFWSIFFHTFNATTQTGTEYSRLGLCHQHARHPHAVSSLWSPSDWIVELSLLVTSTLLKALSLPESTKFLFFHFNCLYQKHFVFNFCQYMSAVHVFYNHPGEWVHIYNIAYSFLVLFPFSSPSSPSYNFSFLLSPFSFLLILLNLVHVYGK